MHKLLGAGEEKTRDSIALFKVRPGLPFSSPLYHPARVRIQLGKGIPAKVPQVLAPKETQLGLWSYVATFRMLIASSGRQD